MAKVIKYNKETQEALLSGINKTVDAVCITLGPRGRNVILEKGMGFPIVTNDGVSIVKEITLADKFENLGASVVKEVATKTNDAAGDGTTTAVVLFRDIVRFGIHASTLNTNQMERRAGIEAATKETVAALRYLAKPIKNDEEIKQVATIAAESAELGAVIAETIKKVGKDGVVTVEESQSFGIETDIVTGMQIDKGYISPYMVTNQETMEAEYRDIYVLITDKTIVSVQDIVPIVDKIAQSGKKDVVIIAEDVTGEALATLIVNKMRGVFSSLIIKAPGFGDGKAEILRDIATITGATVISGQTGSSIETADITTLGKAARIVATKDKTIIVGGNNKKSVITEYVTRLKNELKTVTGSIDKNRLLGRIAKLSGGVAVIKVGAATETEKRYLKLKIEDAVNATRAAIDEGIVPGGGAALLRAACVARKKMGIPSVGALLDTDFKVGAEVFLRALEAPLRQIIENAGNRDSGVIINTLLAGEDSAGYDAKNNVIVKDIVRAGIIDPVKVTRSCIENASSAAAMLLTTEVAIVDEPPVEKK